MANRQYVTDAKTNQRIYKTNDFSTTNKFVYPKGRTFNTWIDEPSRSSSYASGDLIEYSHYIIESLLRDEVYTLRDLEVTSVTSDTSYWYVVIDTLPLIDGYLDGAYFWDITASLGNEKGIISYDYTTQTIKMSKGTETISAGDKCFITNIINTNNRKIDVASFDAFTSWKAKVPIYTPTSYSQIVDDLCFENFMIFVHNDTDGSKVISLDKKTTEDGTLTTPLRNETAQVSVSLSPINDIYSAFEIGYNYNIAKGDTTKQARMNKNSNNLSLTSYYEDLCASVEYNYRIYNTFKYDVKYLHEDHIAAFVQKLVKWFTWQKLMVTWTGDVENHIKYEIGDQVKINHSKIPTAKRNSAFFIVTGKTINMGLVPSVTLNLLEVR